MPPKTTPPKSKPNDRKEKNRQHAAASRARTKAALERVKEGGVIDRSVTAVIGCLTQLSAAWLAAYERRTDVLHTNAPAYHRESVPTPSTNGAHAPLEAVIRPVAGMGARLDPTHPDFMDDPNGHSSSPVFRDQQEVEWFRNKLQVALPPDVFEREKLLFNKYRGPEFTDEETNQYHRAQLTRLGYDIPFDHPPVVMVGAPAAD